MKFIINKKFGGKALVLVLELLALALVIYLVFLPFYPLIKYKIYQKYLSISGAKSNMEIAQEQVTKFTASFPSSDYAVSPNRLIISKIGVNAPIVEAKSADYGLSKGAWRIPESSTPDKGGNTVITGHRFKYLPPNNLTFFLFNKLERGDIISVIWQAKDYFYKISDIKIIPATDTSILVLSKKPIITLFTCHPIYSQENRLVVIGELVKDKN